MMILQHFLVILCFFWATHALDEYFGYSDYPDYPTEPVYPKLSQAEFKKCDKKCVFTEVPLTTKNIGSFPKCAKVCAHIYIDDTSGLTEKKLSTTFIKLKTLIGGLYISVTNYKNLSFLAGLQKIESAGIQISDNYAMVELGLKNLTTIKGTEFKINGNKKLLKLNLPKWKEFSCVGKKCRREVSISSNNPKFCITSKEVKTLIPDKNTRVLVLNGKVCAPKVSNKNHCTKPTAGCKELFGNLKIGPNFNENKVKALKFLYGSLSVNGSTLSNLNCLGNLTRIVQIDSSKAAIDVQNNKNLKTVRMPKLKLIVCDASMVTNRINFWNNTAALLTDYQSCNAIQSALVPEAYAFSMYSMYFDYWTCEELEQFVKEGKKASAKNLSNIAGLYFGTQNPNFLKEKLNY